jgi:hypothetical protein
VPDSSIHPCDHVLALRAGIASRDSIPDGWTYDLKEVWFCIAPFQSRVSYSALQKAGRLGGLTRLSAQIPKPLAANTPPDTTKDACAS